MYINLMQAITDVRNSGHDYWIRDGALWASTYDYRDALVGAQVLARLTPEAVAILARWNAEDAPVAQDAPEDLPF